MGARFLNAPVRVGRNILVCVEKNDEMRLVALDPGNGAIKWNVLLCAYEDMPAPPESPVGIVVDGSSVFIATGKGAVCSVDGLTGRIQWVTTYERVHDKLISGLRLRKLPPRPVTWEENAAYLSGRHLVVMPYDAPELLCFDRTSGELIYQTDAQKALYHLGISDGKLIVAGEGFIEGRKLENGHSTWREPVAPTTGRGLLTDRWILLPGHDEVRVMSPQTGQITARFAVAFDQNLPVGSLHAHDGELYETNV